jgi:hypothetical protein
MGERELCGDRRRLDKRDTDRPRSLAGHGRRRLWQRHGHRRRPNGLVIRGSAGLDAAGLGDVHLSPAGISRSAKRKDGADGRKLLLVGDGRDRGAGSCGDSLPFASYGNLATAQIADGDTVTLVLALIPSKPIEVSLGGDTTELPAAARSEWQPTGHGILEVFATFPQGNVSYGIRIAPDSG